MGIMKFLKRRGSFRSSAEGQNSTAEKQETQSAASGTGPEVQSKNNPDIPSKNDSEIRSDKALPTEPEGAALSEKTHEPLPEADAGKETEAGASSDLAAVDKGTPPEGSPGKQNSEPVATQEPVISWEEALAQTGGDEGFLCELLQDLNSEMMSTMEDLEKQFQEGNWEDAGKLAHALKGGAANLACGPLAKACREVEISAVLFKSGDITMDELKKRQAIGYEKVKAECKRFLEWKEEKGI